MVFKIDITDEFMATELEGDQQEIIFHLANALKGEGRIIRQFLKVAIPLAELDEFTEESMKHLIKSPKIGGLVAQA